MPAVFLKHLLPVSLHLRRFWCLPLLLLGGCTVPLASTAAWASFSLTYSPNNWTLLNSTSGTISSPPSPPPICASPDAPNCFVALNAATGNAKLNGPISEVVGDTTTWRSSAPGSSYPNGYYVSFKLDFVGDELSSAFFKFNGNVVTINIAGTYTADPFYVASNQIIEFGIVSESSNVTQLSISNFRANNAVPGPLPAAGAASAFSISRRLRRRVRGEVPSRKRRQAPHPATYLNLSTTEVLTLPLSFTYPTLPSDPAHGAGVASTSRVISAHDQPYPAAAGCAASAQRVHPPT